MRADNQRVTTTPASELAGPNDGFASPPWRWFVAWAAVGVLVPLTVLGAFTIGPFMLPLAVVGIVVLVRRPRAHAGAVGLLTGVGLPLLWVAYLNRSGPGLVCTSTATSQSCEQQWSPWPWLAVGLITTVGGALAFEGVRVRHRRALVTPPQLSAPR